MGCCETRGSSFDFKNENLTDEERVIMLGEQSSILATAKF